MEKFSLNLFQLHHLRSKAKNGDGLAAYRVGQYYLYWQDDIEKSYIYFELGSSVNIDCMFELAFLMVTSGDLEEEKKGIELMIEAAEQGQRSAQIYLRGLD
jgi:TPR repeat protein